MWGEWYEDWLDIQNKSNCTCTVFKITKVTAAFCLSMGTEATLALAVYEQFLTKQALLLVTDTSLQHKEICL